MECPSCHNAIQPGQVLAVPGTDRAIPHCPYCLDPIPPCSALEGEAAPGAVQVRRVVGRREARRRYLDLLRREGDGQARCPACGRPLGGPLEVMLRNCERCPCGCGADLARLAYAREAYRELRWVPLIYALREAARTECAGCTTLMAAALACQRAVSNNPNLRAARADVAAVLAAAPAERTTRCPDCPVLGQYRALAGEGLSLL